jgi:hypothetical protein
MEDIYLIYKNSLQADGYVEVIGSYLGYNVAKIQKAYIDNRINISKLNPIVIRKELALVWRFADIYDGKVTVKLNTNVAQQLQDKFSEKQLIDLEEKGKIKYELSEKEIQLALEFNKLVLSKIIEDRFSEKFLELGCHSSDLEKASWPSQQYEAALPDNEKKPVLEILACNKGITLEEMVEKVKTKISEDNLSVANLLAEEQKLKSEVKSCENIAQCHRLRHLKFGVSMSMKQMEHENVEISPATIKIIF